MDLLTAHGRITANHDLRAAVHTRVSTFSALKAHVPSVDGKLDITETLERRSRMRNWVALALFISLVGSACSSGYSQDELDDAVNAAAAKAVEAASTTTTPAVTTTNATTTTTTTTTTTQPTTTTSSIAEYDVGGVDVATLSGWAVADAVDSDFLDFATRSCENAVEALVRVSRVLANELRTAGALTVDAMDGTGSVADAEAEFETAMTVLAYGGRAANILQGVSGIGGATEFAGLVFDSAGGALTGVALFGMFALDSEADTIDNEGFGLYGDRVLESVAEFDSLGSRSWSAYCP